MNEAAGDPVQTLDRILAFVTDPVIQQVGLYWRGKIKSGRLPSRADIDPVEIPSLLRHIILWEVEHSPLRFRGRLVGSHIVAMSGRDSTGRYIDYIDDNGVIEAEYRAATASFASAKQPQHQPSGAAHDIEQRTGDGEKCFHGRGHRQGDLLRSLQRQCLGDELAEQYM